MVTTLTIVDSATTTHKYIEDQSFLKWKAIHVNTQSISNKIPMLKQKLQEESPDFLCVYEYWMDEAQARVATIQGYSS